MPDDRTASAEPMSGSGSPIKVALVTNMPAPYRVPVYERLALHDDLDVCLIFSSRREPDREWQIGRIDVRQIYLKQRYLEYRGRFLHLNMDVWSALSRFAPSVVVTTGFNPTALLAYLYTRLRGVAHVCMTDGTRDSESGLSRAHRLLRRWVYRGTKAFIGASEGSSALYRAYGIDSTRIFRSQLCVDNQSFRSLRTTKRYDFIFSGRLVAKKDPLFALEVARQTARRLGRKTSILFLGSGPLLDELRGTAETLRGEVAVALPGFVQQEALPLHYASARILLFPTHADAWGIVANEACAAGVPVIVTPMAGVANELVVDGENGFVLPLDIDAWTSASLDLLTQESMYARFSANCARIVERYNFAGAADGLYYGIRTALESHTGQDRGETIAQSEDTLSRAAD